MEKIDPALAQRVWQRVQRTEPAFTGPDAAALTMMTAEALTDADACQKLARTMGGKGGALLRLARQDRAQAECLKGICRLLTGKTPQIHLPPQKPAPAAATLQRCYTNHLRRLREFERCCADPELGPAFEKLAAEEQDHCRLLLELIGTL